MNNCFIIVNQHGMFLINQMLTDICAVVFPPKWCHWRRML